MATFKISEAGKNGEVTLGDTGLDRTIRRLVGKDDRQFIPYKAISFVEHDRKRIGRDEVVVHVGNKRFEWKITLDAEGFVDAVNNAIATGSHRPSEVTAHPQPAPAPAAAPVPTPTSAGAPPPPPAAAVAAGWHPDPSTRFELRYHDGTRWTEHVSTQGLQSADPVA